MEYEATHSSAGETFREVAAWWIVVAAIAILPFLVMSTRVMGQPLLFNYRLLSPEERFYFVSGYLEGFAVAAQMPQERAGLLQKCFADWGTAKVVTVFDRWLEKNRDKAALDQWSLRVGLFAAIAEECGWKQ